jgi:Ca-activated chloride channel family protein
VTILRSFDDNNIVSNTAVEGFRKFQQNIPFVAYTTLQMRDSAKSGILDGFVMEYQTFINTPELRTQYNFTPFGYRHDSPLYALGDISDSKRKALQAFADYCASAQSQKLGTDYGFNAMDEYQPQMPVYDGSIVQQVQSLWKQEKDSGRKIIAVFVADTSGSMEGDAINSFKESLLTGAQYINKDNAIGLVSFSDNVRINLPISDFDITQRSYFAGAVQDLRANGGTAMYDGIIVGSKLLMEQKEQYPDASLMLFVLTDGESNEGFKYKDIASMMDALKIPIYTIGYNANIDVLETLSMINEAASINADTDDVVYKLANLFNSQM